MSSLFPRFFLPLLGVLWAFSGFYLEDLPYSLRFVPCFLLPGLGIWLDSLFFLVLSFLLDFLALKLTPGRCSGCSRKAKESRINTQAYPPRNSEAVPGFLGTLVLPGSRFFSPESCSRKILSAKGLCKVPSFRSTVVPILFLWLTTRKVLLILFKTLETLP